VTTTSRPAAEDVPAVAEEGLAKKGTIKRHTSAGVKVPVNDDRRPSVTDEILREQEALFDTMIMEEMEVQRDRRKSYPVDTDDNKKPHKARESRKKSAAAVLLSSGDAEKPTKKTNWKLNYDVIIEESGIEPVSFTFKLNNAKQMNDGIDVSSDNGKLDTNHNVVLKSHDDNSRKHAKTVNKNQINNSDDVSVLVNKTKAAKKKIIVKKKVVKKKESGKQQQGKLQTLSPAESKKKVSKTEAAAAAATATATAAVITPFVRTSFGKTFISPLQVSSTKSKFEKSKPKTERKSPPALPLPPPPPPPPAQDSSSDDEGSSSDEDASSLCSSSSSSSSDSGGSSSSTYYDSDDYGDKRIACSVSSFDSGLPSSPVPATDPIGRNTNVNAYCYCTSISTVGVGCGFSLFFFFPRGGAFLSCWLNYVVVA